MTDGETRRLEKVRIWS